MKTKLNLQLDEHLELLQDIAFKSLAGIKVKEINKLRKICKEDTNKYFNKIKCKYTIFLGMLGLDYKINQEIERVLFSYINYLIHELPVENMDSESQINLSNA